MNKVVLREDCAKLCPELQGLTEEELLFLILGFDYHSPYRQLAFHDRIRRAMLHVWGDNNPKIMESYKFKLAIEAYNSLQYNPKEELIKTYQTKVEELQKLFLEEKTATALANLRKAIKETRADIAELQLELEEDILNIGKVKGDAELSLLEQLMSSQKLFKSVTAKK